jgi:putative nucleotidyltransferase with HDIG domain
VSRLGSREVYRIAVAVTGAVTLSTNQKGYGVEAADLWKHSVTAAIAAQLVAKEANEDEDVGFTAGILHDVGKIVLSAAAESHAEKFKQEINGGRSLVEAEEMVLGCNHAEVGSRLLKRWNLPERLIAAVRFHHAPAGAGEHIRLAACVYLGNFIAYFMGYGYGHHALSLSGRDETLSVLNLSTERLPQYMEGSFNRLRQVKSLYNLQG